MSASLPEGGEAGLDARLCIHESVQLHLEGVPVRLSEGQQAYLLLLAAAGKEGMRRDVVIRVLWDEDESRVTSLTVPSDSSLNSIARRTPSTDRSVLMIPPVSSSGAPTTTLLPCRPDTDHPNQSPALVFEALR